MKKEQAVLLLEVLKICRCKSSIPLSRWKDLLVDIKKALAESPIDCDKYLKPHIITRRIETSLNSLELKEQQMKALKEQNKKYKQLVLRYQQKEADMLKLAGRKIYL